MYLKFDTLQTSYRPFVDDGGNDSDEDDDDSAPPNFTTGTLAFTAAGGDTTSPTHRQPADGETPYGHDPGILFDKLIIF